jgi:hypothetical protein
MNIDLLVRYFEYSLAKTSPLKNNCIKIKYLNIHTKHSFIFEV